MGKPIIRMGDKTSHGGTVISGDTTWIIYDKAVARVGDLTVCPKCKGTFPITEGSDDLSGFGQPTARQGDKTACGAVLIATQASAWWGNRATNSNPEILSSKRSLVNASKTIAQETPTICLECLAAAATAGTAVVVRT